jgi:hypothetical protein
MFWVTDNFLMRRSTRRGHLSDPSFMQRVKFRYRKIKREKCDDSESDVLLSADEELLGASENLQQVLPSVMIT